MRNELLIRVGLRTPQLMVDMQYGQSMTGGAEECIQDVEKHHRIRTTGDSDANVRTSRYHAITM